VGTLPSVLLIGFLVVWLALLEGLLSCDNALVLALMVRHLPKHQRTRALRYGIWGAIGFRFVAVIFADFLLRFWWLKVIGGFYLILLAIRHLVGESSDEGEHVKPRFGSGFWATVLNVELADVAFSIDSILAAVALASGLPPALQANRPLVIGIVWTGGILGIIMMRLVAGVFLRLLDRYPGLARGAYYLVAWIGISLVGSGLHDAFKLRNLWNVGWRAQVPVALKQFQWELNDIVFWAGMAIIIVLSFVLSPKRRGGENPGAGAVAPLSNDPTAPNGRPDALSSDPKLIP
jgi:YkoY family integral membrane protein